MEILLIIETIVIILLIIVYRKKIKKNEIDNSKHGICEIEETYDLYEEFFNQTKQLVAIMGNDLTFQYGNRALFDFMEEEKENLNGIPYWELPLWKHSDELKNKIMFSIERIYLGEEVTFETTNTNRKGEVRDIDFTIKPILNSKREIEFLIAMGYDVTELKLAESTLKRTEKELKLFFEHSKDAYIIFRLKEPIYITTSNKREVFDYILENEKISIWNEASKKLLDFNDTGMDSITHKTILDKSDNELYELWNKLLDKEYIEIETELINEKIRQYLNLIMVSLYDELGRYSGSAFVMRDISEEKETKRKLENLANKDGLTKINNRRYYIDLVTTLFLDNKIEYILMLDLDNFKKVNDTYGHSAGDKVLIEVSKVLENWAQNIGLVGRMGGEEFSAIITTGVDNSNSKIEDLRREIEQLNIVCEKYTLKITASIGVSKIVNNDLESLFKRADSALYKAKDQGKNRVIFFE